MKLIYKVFTPIVSMFHRIFLDIVANKNNTL